MASSKFLFHACVMGKLVIWKKIHKKRSFLQGHDECARNFLRGNPLLIERRKMFANKKLLAHEIDTCCIVRTNEQASPYFGGLTFAFVDCTLLVLYAHTLGLRFKVHYSTWVRKWSSCSLQFWAKQHLVSSSSAQYPSWLSFWKICLSYYHLQFHLKFAKKVIV